MHTPTPLAEPAGQARRGRPEAAIWHPFARPERDSDDQPITFVRGNGVWLEDGSGARYLDGVGALEAMAVGHGRRRLADVASRQMGELAFVDVFRHTSRPAVDLAEELVRISPPALTKVHFTPGGSEAVEVALKLALHYHWLHGQAQRRRVITRRGAYHGVTFGAMNCDGNYHSSRNDIYLGAERFGFVAEGPARGEGWGPGARHASGAENFADAVEALGPQNVAAIIVDPVATASGVAVPPPRDLQALRKLCDEHGILLIVDEVITAFGRTGRMFASQLYDVQPDLMPISKALSSGYQPIGATLISDAVAEAFREAPMPSDGIFAHGHTYGAHPVACAVALENIRIIEEEQLAERAVEGGARLRRALDGLAGHPSFVDARGVGLLYGLELVDEGPGLAAQGPRSIGLWFRKRCRDLGLITLALHPGNVMLLAPPLIITDSEIDRMVEILDTALGALDHLLSRS
jgi:adenosylmethionine-8-amino-7-oxononanoate aminotransferase